MVSGCYPLDPYYKALPEAERLAQVKRAQSEKGSPVVKKTAP